MKKRIQSLLDDTRGAGMAEYVILVAVIAVFCIVAFQSFGGAVRDRVQSQTTRINQLK